MASSTTLENKDFQDYVKDFPPIIDGKINAVKFIESAAGLLCAVESLGKMFAPIKYDMEGNIDKIKKLDPKEGSCLLELLHRECLQSQGKPVATEGLLWLNRSLHFFEIMFQEVIQLVEENNLEINMRKVYTIAYEGSVKKYHNWVTQQIFALICRLAPTLRQMLKSFGVDTNNIGQFKTRLTSFNITLHLVRCKIDDFYKDKKLFC
ncbi:glycolipid transfer protein [Leguminivora glycinivorella]|uniref:glycolipid transfer protein n=1 Tax=Leguminivora glycinivorella TaxID=1035111 RepID=UPI00200BEAF4|nr:glycolipid transfer protein [Leguminivora glycinivorella]XP_047988673.1 glycolipid transfer protein [Leguminivora glycinivorella]